MFQDSTFKTKSFMELRKLTILKNSKLLYSFKKCQNELKVIAKINSSSNFLMMCGNFKSIEGNSFVFE